MQIECLWNRVWNCDRIYGMKKLSFFFFFEVHSVLHTQCTKHFVNVFPQINIHFNHSIVCLVFFFLFFFILYFPLWGLHTFWLNQHKLNLLCTLILSFLCAMYGERGFIAFHTYDTFHGSWMARWIFVCRSLHSTNKPVNWSINWKQSNLHKLIVIMTRLSFVTMNAFSYPTLKSSKQFIHLITNTLPLLSINPFQMSCVADAYY